MSAQENLRIGVVSYLNARPFAWGLEQQAAPGVELVCDVPRALSEKLAAGEIDVGLVPTFEYLRGVGDRLVPGLSLSSVGPVESVKLLSQRPLTEVRTVALDAGSRSSQALLKILLAERYSVTPDYVERAPDLDEMLADHDAALLIGDLAMTSVHLAVCVQLDLGEAWWDWQQLPFVFAVWALRDGAPARRLRGLLHAALDDGTENLDRLAREAAQAMPLSARAIELYLTRRMNYELTDGHLESIRRFGRLCERHGLLAAPRELAFADMWTAL